MNLWWMEFFLSKIHPALGCCVFFFLTEKKLPKQKNCEIALQEEICFCFFVVEKFYQIISTPIHWHSVRNFSCIGFKTNTFQSVRRSKLVIGWKNWKEKQTKSSILCVDVKIDRNRPHQTDTNRRRNSRWLSKPRILLFFWHRQNG